MSDNDPVELSAERMFRVFLGLMTLFFVIATLVTLLFGMGKAKAHGEHDWIAKEQRRTDAELGNGLCCGEQDCFKVQPERIEVVADGLIYKGVPVRKFFPELKQDIFVPYKRLQVSSDNLYWICIQGYFSFNVPDKEYRLDRCSFYPHLGG